VKYGNVELHNVCDIVEDGGPGVGVSRLPLDILPRVNQGARNMALMSAGCEIRGMLPEGGSATVTLACADDNTTPPVATVFHGDFCGASVFVTHEGREIKIAWPGNMALMSTISGGCESAFDPRLVRVRLPHIHKCRIVSIEGDLTYPEPGTVPSTTMLSYGSSITHGACGTPPEGAYASQCARRLGCDLINLGFGGSAQMDAAVAEHIASRDDWDLATFEMGINVRQWPLEDFRAAVGNFVSTVAAAHPDKWIFCMDLFTNNCDLGATPVHGEGFREAVAGIVEKQDSDKVVHVDGRDVLTDPTGLRTDLVHPADDGMQEMGRNLADIISRRRQELES